jgi:3-deoxy-D-manno-octulosonate 8-phosphate phosphatase (KDO 8-P phosphatase)
MIEMIVLDVDGTMTDGAITYTASGEEIKTFDVKDGLAISAWNKLGFKSVIITGRQSKMVERRAGELRISKLFQGVENKAEVIRQTSAEFDIDLANVAVIGDDLNDLSMMRICGKTFAPNDASHYVRNMVGVVLEHKGGKGAVREMIEVLIKENGYEKQMLDLYL